MEKILSVVIPTYNMEKYLENCLDSFIYDKSTNDIEILIVNDGSKDNSINIAKEYENKYPNIFKVIDKENGGHGSTINAGLKVANGKYFKVVDADDWVDTHQFGELVKALKNTDADCVCCNYERVFEPSGKTKLEDCMISEPYKIVNIEEIKQFRFYIHSATYKTALIKDIWLDEKCFYVDVEYNQFCVFKCKNVLCIPLNIYRYRLGRAGQSVSLQGFYKHRENHLRVINRLLKFWTENTNELIMSNCTELIKHHYINYIGIYNIDKSTISEIIEFDANLKKYKYFYDATQNNKTIKSLRKHKFKNIGSKAFLIKCKGVLKKMLGR